MPADSTLPIQHCSTADAVTPALFSAPVMAVAPSFAAGTEASEPLKPPMGVRAAATMQTSRGDAELLQSRRTERTILGTLILCPPYFLPSLGGQAQPLRYK